MDNMTAKVSCFARAYHYKNNRTHIFADSVAEKLMGEDYNQIAKNMIDGIAFFCLGFEAASAYRRKNSSDIINVDSPTALIYKGANHRLSQ